MEEQTGGAVEIGERRKKMDLERASKKEREKKRGGPRSALAKEKAKVCW